MRQQDETRKKILNIELSYTIENAKLYIDNIYLDMNQASKKRINSRQLNEKDIQDFFRAKQRVDNTKLILQYLIALVEGSLQMTINKNPSVKPYEQFKNSLEFSFNQFKSEDVRKAIINDFTAIKFMEEMGQSECDDQIDFFWEHLFKYINAGKSPTNKGFTQLLKGLMEHVNFWFLVRNYNPDKIRRSDFFIYKLSQHLLQDSLEDYGFYVKYGITENHHAFSEMDPQAEKVILSEETNPEVKKSHFFSKLKQFLTFSGDPNNPEP